MQLGPAATHGEAALAPGLLHGSVRALLVSLATSVKFAATSFKLVARRVQTASVMGDPAWFFRAKSIGED